MCHCHCHCHCEAEQNMSSMVRVPTFLCTPSQDPVSHVSVLVYCKCLGPKNFAVHPAQRRLLGQQGGPGRHVTELARQSLVFVHDVGFRGGHQTLVGVELLAGTLHVLPIVGSTGTSSHPTSVASSQTVAKTMSRTLQAPFSVVCVGGHCTLTTARTTNFDRHLGAPRIEASQKGCRAS